MLKQRSFYFSIKYFLSALLLTANLCLTEEINNKDLQPALIFGLYPALSPEMLEQSMQSLVKYIERVSGRQVSLITANSYARFLQNAKEGQYDLAFAPSHFAAVLSDGYHYEPLLLSGGKSRTLVVSHIDSNIKTIEDLQNKKIATPSKLAHVSLIAFKQFSLLGIGTDKLQIIKKSTHDRSLHAVLSHEVDAAIISEVMFTRLSANMKKRIHIIEAYDGLLGSVILATEDNKSIDTLIHKIKNDFPSSPERKQLFSAWSNIFILTPVTKEQLLPLKDIMSDYDN